MSHPALVRSASTPLAFEDRHPWLSCIGDGGRVWATRMGCVWVYPDEVAVLD